jgi:hypothetical protein
MLSCLKFYSCLHHKIRTSHFRTLRVRSTQSHRSEKGWLPKPFVCFRWDQYIHTRSNRSKQTDLGFPPRFSRVVVFGATEVHNYTVVIHLGAIEFYNSVTPTGKVYIIPWVEPWLFLQTFLPPQPLAAIAVVSGSSRPSPVCLHCRTPSPSMTFSPAIAAVADRHQVRVWSVPTRVLCFPFYAWVDLAYFLPQFAMFYPQEISVEDSRAKISRF